MFDNIGGKIKALAKVLCWIGIIASVISGIVMIVSGSSSRYYSGPSPVLTGFLTIILGALFSWIGSFFTYGFGQLIEDTEMIRSRMDSSPSYAPNQGGSMLSNAAKSIEQERMRNEWTCVCGASNSNTATYCFRCRRPRNAGGDQPKVACPHCGAMNRTSNETCFACNQPMKQ